MATWSISQKRFIDTPSTGVSSPVQQQSGMTSIGVPDDKLRNAFFKLGLAKPSSASNLSTLYNFVKPPDVSNDGSTAAEKSRAKTGIAAIDQINLIPEKIRKKTGTPKAFLYSIKSGLPGGVGLPFIKGEDEEDIANLDQRYFLLTQAVMTAIQGSRPSDYDVRSYQQKAGPNIKLSDTINQQRISNLLTLMQQRAGNIGVTAPAKKSSPWEVIR